MNKSRLYIPCPLCNSSINYFDRTELEIEVDNGIYIELRELIRVKCKNETCIWISPNLNTGFVISKYLNPNPPKEDTHKLSTR